jgi:hypothetical protein
VAFAQHYNTRRDACFMVLTAISPENPGDEFGPSQAFVVRKPIDVDDDQLYGEYLGAPAEAPPPRPPAGRLPGAERLLHLRARVGSDDPVLHAGLKIYFAAPFAAGFCDGTPGSSLDHCTFWTFHSPCCTIRRTTP